jgi:hypothetical protein
MSAKYTSVHSSFLNPKHFVRVPEKFEIAFKNREGKAGTAFVASKLLDERGFDAAHIRQRINTNLASNDARQLEDALSVKFVVMEVVV